MNRTVFLFIGLLASMVAQGYDLVETPDSIALSNDGEIVWQYNHRAEEGKPYIHPLATTEGQIFSDLRPKDHPWHRAFWFSWKKINGVNYWEENRKTGVSEGLTQVLKTRRSVASDQTVTIKIDLAYAPAKTGKVVMTEERTVTIHPPTDSGAYTIDWSATFHALETDVVLDRTPIPGQPGARKGGGYAGLSLRMNKEVHGGVFSNSEGLFGTEAHRKPARWMSYSAPQGGSILMLDHPRNLRYPGKGYFFEKMPFMMPAVIHDAPYTIDAGKTLDLRYQTVVYPEKVDAESAEKAWKEWVDSTTHKDTE
jgi:hypothetical protein